MSSSRFLVVSKYQIDLNALLGKGAMGKVYLGCYKVEEGVEKTYFAVKEISVNSSMMATDALLQ